MQLIVGGAFAGKRKVVRSTHKKCSWVSSYNGDSLDGWKTRWDSNTTLVLEGWENWIGEELQNELDDLIIRDRFLDVLRKLKEEEKRNETIVLIMLELGRGIVPMDQNDRRLRDLAGWLVQDAAKISTDVHYVWHGLSRKMK
ncbi:bifunctional adenosylcobinamide kinase/adenosylcobinamide-phosphate guanylyltransferase [Evansella sp. AB-rgal1]|uniref:bifunctional adenosylcobinamide kinase/adenosylcobinamide-phosphate guanylyltransferase n=1 Tax=Evansella sp. AB-rgal1 TaxID=3242696 RepID=UPI00359CD83B